MPLESGTTIADLNASWPTGGDPKSEGDDHLRLIKTVLKNDVYPKAESYSQTETDDLLDGRVDRTGDTMTGDLVATGGSAGGTVENVEASHDPAGVSSWRIIGDSLECWGRVTTNAGGNAAISFPKTFAQNPAIVLTPDGTSAFYLTASTTSLTTTSSNIACSNNGSLGAYTVRYHAIGEWDGVS